MELHPDVIAAISSSVAQSVTQALSTASHRSSRQEQQRRVQVGSSNSLPANWDDDDDFLPQREPRFPLPSVHRQGSLSSHETLTNKKRKRIPSCRGKTRTVSRELICIPYTVEKLVPIPRKDKRENLAKCGLLGVINFSSDFSEQEMQLEITSVFRKAFNLDEEELLSFSFMRTLSGTKKLQVFLQSEHFQWGGQQVMSLFQRGSIYIMSGKDHRLQTEKSSNNVIDVSVTSLTDNANQSYSIETHGNVNEETLCHTKESAHGLSMSFAENAYSEVVQATSDDENQLFESLLLDNIDNGESVEELSYEERPIAAILEEHALNVMTSDIQRVIIRRQHAFVDALKWLARRDFHPERILNVQFIGETGVDQGGPRRDFLQTLAYHLTTWQVFCGEPGNLLLSCSASSLMDNLPYTAGKITAIIICQGGPPLNIFSESLINAIAGIEYQPTVADVPNARIRKVLKQVEKNEWVDTEEVQRIKDEIEFHENLSPSNNRKFVLRATSWYVQVKSLAHINRFTEGLDVLKVGQLIKLHPKEMKGILCGTKIKQLDANTVYELFHAQFSETGSNMRMKEEATDIQFILFLNDCGSKENDCSLCDFLHFTTGASMIPPGGYDHHLRPSIQFSEETKFPIASTCSLLLTLPLNLSDEQFKINMITAVNGTSGFDLI